MATQDKSGFEKAESPGDDKNDDDAVWIDKPEEGESVQGILLERTPDAGDYDTPLYKLRRTDDHDDDAGPVVLMWAGGIDQTVQHNDITPGSEMLIEGVDSYTFQTDEGGEENATEYEVYFK